MNHLLRDVSYEVKKIRTTKGASGNQYADIACVEKEKENLATDVWPSKWIGSDWKRVLSGCQDVAQVYWWGVEPICDVCNRVGHISKSCCQRKASLSVRRRGCGENVLHSVVSKMVGFESVKRHISVSVNTQRVWKHYWILVRWKMRLVMNPWKLIQSWKYTIINIMKEPKSTWRLGAREMVLAASRNWFKIR